MANNNVRFIKVALQETYDALLEKDSKVLYWIEDTQRLYCGETLYGSGALATQSVSGLLSPQDKKKLDELVSGGISNLSPIDGTIVLTDSEDGSKHIKVAISENTGNALVAVEGGLFVPTVEVPEYVIEKQTTAEDGYFTTYKLKKTLNGNSVYVGDSINVPRDIVVNKGSLEIVDTDGVPYESAVVGDPYIDLVLNDEASSHIYIPVKGLVDTYTAGSGISIENGVVSVKIANTNGLSFVDGVINLALATKDSAGALSAVDKAFIDSIPEVYATKEMVKDTSIQVKYNISDIPNGTLINYGEKEIRIMCPVNAEFKKQNVGAGGDANTYYMALKTYVPNNNVVGYIEHLGNQVDEEILTNLSVDEYGRRYQTTWLGLAKFDEATGVWSYYGANSTVNKMIGWDYQIDWYDADNKIIASDCVRINLTNESCHNYLRPYYGPSDISTDIVEMQKNIDELQESFAWGSM